MRFAALALLLFAYPTFADSPRDVSVDDDFTWATITQVAISPHGLTKKSNRKAKMEWDLAWFEKYLKAS